jgi:hypothetical protein
MTLKAGSVASFGDSMALAMEDALAAELMALKGIPLPTDSAQERRMLFCAIAQGVLEYLHANQADLRLALDHPYEDHTGHVVVNYGGP